jgi:ribonucleoside-triphosphate reductase
MAQWSNLGKIVYKRTYSRDIYGLDGKPIRKEDFRETVDRAIQGNLRLVSPTMLLPDEEQRLRFFLMNRKAGPAGRGWWFSGSTAQDRFGGRALTNCWFDVADDWNNFVLAQDLLMLGGGVGMSVENRYVSKLPKVKRGVTVSHRGTRDADFIVPDSREGWCELTRRTLESFFVTGKSFTFSTVCLRGAGEPIHGFGGKASGPIPMIQFIERLNELLHSREGRSIRPIDAGDIMCAIGELVVSGNVRRSAIILIGDPFDKEFLKVKRWDLGPIPKERRNANYSVMCDDIEDLHPLFWKSYEAGEPIGIVNLQNIQKYGRMGELKRDAAKGVNPCAEATLEPKEPCNLQELALANLSNLEEFVEAARLMHRWGKRVTLEKYNHPDIEEVIKRNRRVGTGITGCLQSPLFAPQPLDTAYQAIQEENRAYSTQLGIPESNRTTVVKPSGTLGKMFDCLEGIHPAYSRWMIQRVRFAANDPLIPLLRAAGHPMEPESRMDGTRDNGTLVVDFYVEWPAGTPTVDEGFDTWRQLDTLMLAQKHWSDQAVSVTVYYKREEINQLKEWLAQNLQYIKCISFLAWSGHGFVQAPKEPISHEQYDKLSSKIKELPIEQIQGGEIETMECASGHCPIK